MNIVSIGITSVATITVICFLVAQIAKNAGLDNRWLPVICGILGGVLGPVAMFAGVPEFPANDVLTAVAVGIVSGLAATGANQVYKQLKGE